MKKNHLDYFLLCIVIFLVLFGLMMVSSASINLSQEKFGTSYYFLKNQLFRGLLPGLALGIIAFFIPYRFWRKIAFPLLLINIALLSLVYVPALGEAHGGARRWLDLGPFVFQPSEFLKLSLIIALAAWFAARKKKISDFTKTVLPFIILMSAIAVLLVFEPDFGTLGVIGLTAFSIYFLAGAKFSHMALIGTITVALFFALIKIFPHAANRVMVFLHPETDPSGLGYQINQALLSIGSGGLLGLGLGQGMQKFKYLPEPAGDSIAAVIGEELGFLGLFFLILFFFAFAFRTFRISKKAPDDFSQLLAGGIGCWIVFQALINIAAISDLIPLTGITLPFISLGGSSLVINLVAIGILLNISKHSEK